MLKRYFSQAALQVKESNLILTSPFNPITFPNKNHVFSLSDHQKQKHIDAILSQEQKALVQIMHQGHNIYFTGTILD